MFAEIVVDNLPNQGKYSRVLLNGLLPLRTLEVFADFHHIVEHSLSELLYRKLFHKVGKVANAVVKVCCEFQLTDAFAEGLVRQHEKFELHLHIFFVRHYFNSQLFL